MEACPIIFAILSIGTPFSKVIKVAKVCPPTCAVKGIDIPAFSCKALSKNR